MFSLRTLSQRVGRTYSTWWKSLPEISCQQKARDLESQTNKVDEMVQHIKSHIEDQESWISKGMMRAVSEGRTRLNIYYYQLNISGPRSSHNALVADKLNAVFHPTLKFTDYSSDGIAKHLKVEWEADCTK